MKTSKLTFLLLLGGTLAVASSPATLSSRVVLSEVQTGVYKLIYDLEAPAKINLKILDEKGNIVLEESMNRKSGFTKKYNLTKAGQGSYTFRFKENGELIEKKVTYKRIANVAIKEKKDNKISVSIADASYRTTVSFYDASDRLLFQERVEKGKGMFKIYDLSRVRTKHVLVEITDNLGVIKKSKF